MVDVWMRQRAACCVLRFNTAWSHVPLQLERETAEAGREAQAGCVRLCCRTTTRSMAVRAWATGFGSC